MCFSSSVWFFVFKSQFEVKSHLQKLRDRFSLESSNNRAGLARASVGGFKSVRTRTPLRGYEYMNLKAVSSGAAAVETLHRTEPKVLALLRHI
jgi:hypothetical protein